jgi:hypothetical protein
MQSASHAAPAPGAAETIPAAHSGAENTGVDTANATNADRPGDIPYDQAAAEHENPALE